MSGVIKCKSELVFCYDIKDANPNGDPTDSNKPRIDEEKNINIVTDVRLKRTIRDYLYEYKGYNGNDDKDIFVRELKSVKKKEGIKDGKARSEDFSSNTEEILGKCIDIRLFGGVLPLKKDSITFTGPVQFQMGRSMHEVELKYIKGTGAFASQDGKKQKTYREEYVLPYSFISFYGIINDKAAEHINLTEEDINLLLEGMWEGTKNLITRSKFGQMPRLLMKINYNKEGFFIGDVNKYIKLVTDLRDEKIRDVEDFVLDVTNLRNILNKYNDKIGSVEYIVDERLKLKCDDGELKIKDLLTNKMKQVEL
ncbi:type I-B CRISPR-associated protein Cas7/Csh2 [Vallitalea guaymasensis]|uniref:type I-B CRISPR-associated protein Cas7/Csh2 n=1 Tax=Vallitalea guaymasensis TaxID=1185412 RepID=UPI002355CB17|nr:type I-B CRISPR-associated protein Cas7/Csh2 [Vallitalea guaymasensis]